MSAIACHNDCIQLASRVESLSKRMDGILDLMRRESNQAEIGYRSLKYRIDELEKKNDEYLNAKIREFYSVNSDALREIDSKIYDLHQYISKINNDLNSRIDEIIEAHTEDDLFLGLQIGDKFYVHGCTFGAEGSHVVHRLERIDSESEQGATTECFVLDRNGTRFSTNCIYKSLD